MAAAAVIIGKLDVRKLTNQNATPAKAFPRLDFNSEFADINTDDDIERLLGLPEDNETQANGNIPKSTASLPRFNNMEGHSRANRLFERNIDAIIPKQFLKTIKRTGLRSTFFFELRFNNDGTERPDSVLNKEPYR